MTCGDARDRLVDYQRGRLALAAESEVRAHLDGCAECTRADAAEHELTKALEQRLPQHPASLALKRRLAAQWPAPTAATPSWWSRWRPALTPALAVAALLL
jgi:anti-sigma factor RsiW